jgi:catechol 2,3-dioxygenase-like lactoylglutathione lyase family enzyme
MKTIAIGLAAVVSLGLTGAALAEPPAALKPQAIAGPGWNVLDLEAEKAWYMDKLGMKLVNTYQRDGKPFEYIMGFDGLPGSAILALLLSPQRPAGPNRMARLILAVPDAKALAAHLAKEGVPNREVVPNVAYFIDDPEGNPVELYTPPKN